MPAANRSAGRDVHIYDSKNPSEELGGLILTNGVTNKNFYMVTNIMVIIHGSYFLCHNGDTVVPEDDDPLQPGNYYIVTTAPIQVNVEQPLFRTISTSSGTRNHGFRDTVRARDQQCVITGVGPINAAAGRWAPLQAAHVFPLAHQQHWDDSNLSRWITQPPINGELIDSVQNGLLLRADIHQLFDSYDFSINPNDNYKIVFFSQDPYHVAGNYLPQDFLNNPDRPVDALLLWHFRQAVLTNMKGAGAPVFEHDYPSGSDMVGDILSGPMGGERMEFELFSRLGAIQDV
ncbi:MAG: hypothetical protein M1830_003901 [Pleopsidium flavum]|nr:MAG: hypothetical protein M1830_003901 [Pleopsidium flavum]